MNKKYLLIGAVLIVGLIAGGKYATDVVAAEKIAKEKAAAELQVKIENEEAHLAQARSAFDTYLTEVEKEKLELVKEQAEAERQAEIEANTFVVKKKNTPVYASAEGGDSILKLDKLTSVYVTSRVQDESGVDKWYEIQYNYEDLDTIGWIEADKLTARRQDLIYRPYDNVDYEAWDKVDSYESNPYTEAKGIYVSGHIAANKRLDDLIDLANRTALNAFVIDVKDDNGNMLFYSESAAKYSPSANDRYYIKDMEALMKS